MAIEKERAKTIQGRTLRLRERVREAKLPPELAGVLMGLLDLLDDELGASQP